ncbi:MAG: phage major capsid protein [Acidobacteriota bacterium]
MEPWSIGPGESTDHGIGPGFRTGEAHAKTLSYLTSCSQKLSQDSLAAVGGLLMELLAESIADEEDRMILKGNADPFTGLLFAANVNQVTMATGLTAFWDVTSKTGSI